MPLFVSAGLWILALVIMGIALALKPREKERKKKISGLTTAILKQATARKRRNST